MISRNEYLYVRNRVANLTMRLTEFEVRSEIYQMFRKWEVMTQEEKDRLIKVWDDYYKQCREGFYGQQYKEAAYCSKMYTKTHSGEWKERLDNIVRDVTESKEPFLKKPSSIDPRDFPSRLYGYYAMVRQLREYKDIVQEYAPVYEPKREATL